MKLNTTFALALALTLPATIRAQEEFGGDQDPNEGQGPAEVLQEESTLSIFMDSTGLDIRVDNTYVNGRVAILVSTEIGSLQLPQSLGGDELGLGSPMWLVAFAETVDDFHLPISLDVQTLSSYGITFYVQAVAIDYWDWEDRPLGSDEEGPVPCRVSNLVTVDFADIGHDNGGGNDDNDGNDDGNDCRCPNDDDEGGDDSSDPETLKD